MTEQVAVDEQRMAVPRDAAARIARLSVRKVDHWAPARRRNMESDLRPDQIVLREMLNLQPLRRRIAEDARRDKALIGKVERRRGAMGNKPLLAGTRMPVETVQRYLPAGHSIDDALEAFPMLTVSDVESVQRQTVA
jgi:uncharacterized protein (DUF433 family)